MPDVQEPVQNTETVTPEVIGSPAGENTATPTVVPEVTPVAPANPELEELRLKLNQAEMRANQLDNQRKAAEKTAAEEAGEYKKLYEEEQAANQARDARDLRNSVIDSYDNEIVKTAARKLVAVNDDSFYWNGNVASPEDAKAQVKSQLDALAETIAPAPVAPVVPEVQAPAATIDANNPPQTMGVPTDEEQSALRDRLANIVF